MDEIYPGTLAPEKNLTFEEIMLDRIERTREKDLPPSQTLEGHKIRSSVEVERYDWAYDFTMSDEEVNKFTPNPKTLDDQRCGGLDLDSYGCTALWIGYQEGKKAVTKINRHKIVDGAGRELNVPLDVGAKLHFTMRLRMLIPSEYVEESVSNTFHHELQHTVDFEMLAKFHEDRAKILIDEELKAMLKQRIESGKYTDEVISDAEIQALVQKVSENVKKDSKPMRLRLMEGYHHEHFNNIDNQNAEADVLPGTQLKVPPHKAGSKGSLKIPQQP